MKFGYIIDEDGNIIRVLRGTKIVTYRGFRRIEYDVKFIEADNWNDAIVKIRRLNHDNR